MAVSFALEGTRSSSTKFAFASWTAVFLPSASFLSCLDKVSAGFSLTWNMSDFQVVPLQDINPFPNTGVDACLVGEMTERSEVRLNNYGMRPLAIVFPLGYCYTMPK